MTFTARVAKIGAAVFALSAADIRAQLPIWSPITSQFSLSYGHQIVGADYGNGVFIATAAYEEYPSYLYRPIVSRSTDGRVWASPALPAVPSADVVDVGFVNGRFILGFGQEAGINKRVDAILFSSVDGASWSALQITNSTGALVGAPSSYAYGNGIYVASAGVRSRVYVTSADGVNWIARLPGLDSTVLGTIVYFKGLFYATTTENGHMSHELHSSADGVNWTPVPNLTSRPRQLAASRSVLLMNAPGGLLLSRDGSTFTTIVPEGHAPYWPLRYVDGKFLSMTRGNEQIGPAMAIASYDGRSWNAIGVLSASDPYSFHVLSGSGIGVALSPVNVYAGTTSLLPAGVREPVIVRQPDAQAIAVGDAVTFTVATDSTSDAYQWYPATSGSTES